MGGSRRRGRRRKKWLTRRGSTIRIARINKANIQESSRTRLDLGILQFHLVLTHLHMGHLMGGGHLGPHGPPKDLIERGSWTGWGWSATLEQIARLIVVVVGMDDCQCLDVIIADKSPIQLRAGQLEGTVQIIGRLPVEVDDLAQDRLVIVGPIRSCYNITWLIFFHIHFAPLSFLLIEKKKSNWEEEEEKVCGVWEKSLNNHLFEFSEWD